jgi:sulfite reductase (NADPH) hemoprotein beta-component
MVENAAGERGFEVLVGGGLGRTPYIGQLIGRFVPKLDLLSYLEAVLRVYNLHGRRDNLHKARVKILVNAIGADEFRSQVEAEWELIKDGPLKVDPAEIERIAQHFAAPAYEQLPDSKAQLDKLLLGRDRELANFVQNNVARHKQPGYAAVVVSLKQKDVPPGDMTDEQMEAFAALSERFGFGELRITHTQNLVLPDVRIRDLPELHGELAKLGLATPNYNKLTDVIACPGLDYCALANARSIPLALEVMQRFEDIDYQNDLGELNLKISGCINACGHHHIGNIGILGIDKGGIEFYQIMLGGSAGHDASLGEFLGKALPQEQVVDALTKVLTCYLGLRHAVEDRLIDVVRRVGLSPFKEAVYGPPTIRAGVAHANH